MIKEELAQVREWIQGELDSEQVQPWAARRYQLLLASIDRLLESGNTTVHANHPSATRPDRSSVDLWRANVVALDSVRRLRSATVTAVRSIR
jgi:hypothetical protein